MAGHKDHNKRQTRDRIQDRKPNRVQDWFEDMLQKADQLLSTDQPAYTAAMHNVLNHNINIAKGKATNAKIKTTLEDLSVQVQVDSFFTTLSNPVDFTLEWEGNGLLGLIKGPKALKITPSVDLPLPPMTAGAPSLAYWRYSFDKVKNNAAALSRFIKFGHAAPLSEAFTIRNLAEFKNSQPSSSEGEPIISFLPHDNEIKRRGAMNVSKTVRQMEISKDYFGCTKYSIRLPMNLQSLHTMWVYRHVEGYVKPGC